MDHSEITWVANRDLKITALSQRLRGMVGRATAAAGSLGITDLFGADDPSRTAPVAHARALDGERVQFEHPLGGANYRITLQPLRSASGPIVGVFGTADLQAAAPRAEDPSLEARVAGAIARAESRQGLCSVLRLAIDNLRDAGDREVLAAAGARLARLAGAGGTVTPIGTGEFLIVVDALTTNHDAHESARKVLESFKEPFSAAGMQRTLRASAGFAIFPFTARTPRELIDAAGEAMRAVRAAGGNAVEAARPQVPRRDVSKIHACATSFAAKPRSAQKVSGLASG